MKPKKAKKRIRASLLIFDPLSLSEWLLYESDNYYHYWLIRKKGELSEWVNDAGYFNDIDMVQLEILTPYGWRNVIALSNRYSDYNGTSYCVDFHSVNLEAYYKIEKPQQHGKQLTLNVEY